MAPAREALAITARELAATPPARGGLEDTLFEDPFDYAAEDRLRAAWEAALPVSQQRYRWSKRD